MLPVTPKSILIAEDYEHDIAMLKLALQRANIANPVVVVRDGADAVACLRGKGAFADRKQFPAPGILFLDLKMPRMDGFQVLEWLGAHPEFRDLLVIVLTARCELKDINQAYALGAHSYLVKPCLPAELDNVVQAHPRHWAFSRPPKSAKTDQRRKPSVSSARARSRVGAENSQTD
ncbi:MAG TPA: response regulator [Verrucomicrobiae bacterium]|nr:response regulator [Verrucomicrobiae bacterium]